MKEKVIGLLNKDLEGEHAAIIQYLTHAYSVGEGEMACEVEAIAREEMRHLDWLAEAIVGLGGIPSLTRGEMRTGGQSVADWMRNNVLQEQDAIAMYQEHIQAIAEPRIRRLLERILSDEKSHRGDFGHFAEKAQEQGLKDLRGSRRGKATRTQLRISFTLPVMVCLLLVPVSRRGTRLRQAGPADRARCARVLSPSAPPSGLCLERRP